MEDDKLKNMIKDKVANIAPPDESRQKITECVNRHIRTTMVGAVAAVEHYFGFLWGLNEDRELTVEEQELADKFAELRSQVFDIGNLQMRNFAGELHQYIISRKKYSLTLPVIPRKKDGQDEN